MNSDAALEVGLLHQEAVDGKLNAKVNGISIFDVIRNRHGDTPLPPHWHKTALQRLRHNESAPGRDDNDINALCNQGKIRRSTSTLGILFDSVHIDELMDAWRNSYGGFNYSFEMVQQGNGMRPDPLLDRDLTLWDKRVPRARAILDGFFEERQKLLDISRSWDAERALISDTRQNLFSDCTTSDDYMYNSVAFYHAQLERFNCRVRDRTQYWTASQVEWQLEPAWQVCPQELCGFAASRGSFCFLSTHNRNNMQYKGRPKHRSFVQSLLARSMGRDSDEDAIDALMSRFSTKCNLA